MTGIKRLVYLSLLGATVFASNQHAAIADFRDGNSLLRECTGSDPEQLACLGYIMGITDIIRGKEVLGYKPCLYSNISVQQLHDVVVLYLRSQPAIRHYSAASLVVAALGHSFPCR
jgi:hypothetical protein